MNGLGSEITLVDAEALIDAYAALRNVPRDMLTDKRSQTAMITGLRHQLIWLLRAWTPLSFAQIGQVMGGRDYATIHAANAKICDRICRDTDYRAHVADSMVSLRAVLQGNPAQAKGETRHVA